MTTDHKALLEKHVEANPIKRETVLECVTRNTAEFRHTLDAVSRTAALAAIEEAVRVEREEIIASFSQGFTVYNGNQIMNTIRARGNGGGDKK